MHCLSKCKFQTPFNIHEKSLKYIILFISCVTWTCMVHIPTYIVYCSSVLMDICFVFTFFSLGQVLGSEEVTGVVCEELLGNGWHRESHSLNILVSTYPCLKCPANLPSCAFSGVPGGPSFLPSGRSLKHQGLSITLVSHCHGLRVEWYSHSLLSA